MMSADEQFWSKKYKTGKTGWDIGHISTPIKEYIDQLTDKSLKILIPGGGNSYEAEYLFRNGFKNIFVADISEFPLNNLSERVPAFPKLHLLHANFFEHSDGYDLIFEQTFFCALNPNLRNAYATKIHELLKPSGKLVGLLFNFPLTNDGPPFGGSQAEYQSLFQEQFHIKKMETAYNSIPPRAGNELFFQLSPK